MNERILRATHLLGTVEYRRCRDDVWGWEVLINLKLYPTLKPVMRFKFSFESQNWIVKYKFNLNNGSLPKNETGCVVALFLSLWSILVPPFG